MIVTGGEDGDEMGDEGVVRRVGQVREDVADTVGGVEDGSHSGACQTHHGAQGRGGSHATHRACHTEVTKGTVLRINHSMSDVSGWGAEKMGRGRVGERGEAAHEQVRCRRRERFEEIHEGTGELGPTHTATTPVESRFGTGPRTATDAMR